jgi:hypothetical protein
VIRAAAASAAPRKVADPPNPDAQHESVLRQQGPRAFHLLRRLVERYGITVDASPICPMMKTGTGAALQLDSSFRRPARGEGERANNHRSHEGRERHMKTAKISKANHPNTAILCLLAFAAPACLADAGEQEEPGAPAATASDPTAVALSASAEARMPGATSKPLPVRPPLQPGVALGAELPVKPAHASASPAQLSPLSWAVSLTASSTFLWPTQFSTLTATTSADVGPTPFYLIIRRTNSGVVVASCGAGTTCSVPVTEPTEEQDEFTAYVETFDGSNVQAASDPEFVYWHRAFLELSASPTTLPVGGTSTLTATAFYNVGPSPFYIEIFDVTTGTFLAVCGFGTSCSAQVIQAAATTHTYRAFLSQVGTSLPLPGLQETTAASYITWTTSGWSVSLSTPTFGLTETVTATASIDVGPTPYWIEIFNEFGTRLGFCGSGSTCTVQFPGPLSTVHLVAFLSALDPNLPPANIQASSNVVLAPVVIP